MERGDEMSRKQFRKWFLEEMERFLDMAYRPPGRDKLKDAETYQGLLACAEDLDFKAEFIEDDH
jgi:hypothetical protein